MELAELAAVVPGRDGDNAIARGGAQASGHRCAHSLLAGAVDHDLVGAIGILVELALDATAKRGAVRIGCRSDESLVARTHFAAAPGTAARKGGDDAGRAPDRRRRAAHGS